MNDLALKRRRPEDEQPARCCAAPKRQRKGSRHRLEDFSDEVLLRILGCLPVRHLVSIERVSRQFQQLASDPEIWRAKFYERWISPRARRTPLQSKSASCKTPSTKKLVRWLEHGAALRDGVVDWKRQYRIRNNWDKGAARFQEVELAVPPTPTVLAKVHRGLIFTVDTRSGLRVWEQKDELKKLLWNFRATDCATPFSLAVDTTAEATTVAVGYDNGSFAICGFDRSKGFGALLSSQPARECPVTSIALATPYILTLCSNIHINLYQLIDSPECSGEAKSVSILSTLHAEAPLQCAALSLRCTSSTIIATVSYAFNQLHAGWCLGLQEIRLSLKGDVVGSRLTSTIATPLEARYHGPKQWQVSSRSTSSTPFAMDLLLKSPPTSLSYSHPFLMASLPDNTIMSYVVTSDDDKLEISTGKRLWGHTSAISSAEVSNRGKAVSVSAKGEEIRVWELEEALTTPGRDRPSTEVKARSSAPDVTTAIARRGGGLGLALREMRRELATTRGWVGFDDEQVVVMGERDQRQIMACYDFT